MVQAPRVRVFSFEICEVGMSDELKIVLEDVKEKFDLVIEAVNGAKERLDRHEAGQEERLQRIEDRLIFLQKDFNDHRENTELHAVKKKKKAS